MQINESNIDEIGAPIKGRLIDRSSPDYDDLRAIFYGGVDRRPGLIVRAAGPEDVAHVVRVARDRGIEVAVRSGGHSVAGHSATEGGILLDLRDFAGIDIDLGGRTAWPGAGLTAAAYTEATGPQGLA